MKGYIYITGTGADPGMHDNLGDPLFGDPPTLGACMTNLRQFADLGDYLFVVSGKTPNAQQYIIGGMRVAEKIDALAAYGRFPQNRLKRDENGFVRGNIIVDAQGRQHPLDHHKPDTFERRIRNYIIGDQSAALQTDREIELGRERSLRKLSEMFERPGNRAIDILGRHRKLDEGQVHGLMDWLRGIKAAAK
ncbi:hypothetical protein GCM10023219_20390 [Stakelama sediminis]|uniref:Nucleotide modification associated domain-containing protein n=1 Tax=Stakelama sediminis TaxID=463200 RepID=A0A840Z276_9SPHN|nr:hypothetical protein [Stakelama sediminis]MBB5720241.1 hypothetical protein [Stakelama sediminis]